VYLLTSKQMRELEERAIKDLSIPSLLLMENAAMQTVKHVMGFSKVAVFCGHGNNGGDGFAIARLLHVKGHNVSVSIVGDERKIKGDALTNLKIVQKLGLIKPVTEADIIIDAIFGTGFRGAITDEETIKAIEFMNNSPAPVIAVDIPTGVEADTGKVANVAVRANTTVSFAVAKLGHILHPGTEYCGKLIVEDISVLVENDNYIEMLDNLRLPPRPARSNKGTHGRVCVIAGCSDMPGAAALCSKAAYKAGAGLVHACVEPEVARVIRTGAYEVITSTIENVDEAISLARVIALGPGIGRGESAQNLVRKVLTQSDKPMVVDADALIAIAADKSVLHKLKAPCIITPHPGEMAALCGLTIKEVVDDLINVASSFAKEYGVVTLLKDARTVIASPDGRVFINPTGTPALAKAGSGDVLTGIIAAFMAQGFEDAAVLGAYVHGKAGELAAEALSVYGVTASDVIDYVPKAMTCAI